MRIQIKQHDRFLFLLLCVAAHRLEINVRINYIHKIINQGCQAVSLLLMANSLVSFKVKFLECIVE